MWIASKLGFFSVVQKAAGEWHIRARTRQDLVNLIRAAYLNQAEVTDQIEEWPEADYRWRIIVRDADEFAGLFTSLADTVTYANFKAEVGRTPDQEDKLPAYHQLWHALHELQERDRQ